MASPRSSHPSRETLSEYHDGELDASVRPEVRRHILECGACREYLDDLTSGSRLYQRLPARRPPTSMRREMYQRIDAHQRRPWLHFPFPFPGGGRIGPNVVGLAVATVLLAFLVPQLVGVWSAVFGPAGADPQRAARVAAPAGEAGGSLRPASPAGAPPEASQEPPLGAPLVEPRVTVVPPTEVPPSPTSPPPPTATAVPARPSATPRAPAPTARPAQGTPATTAQGGQGTSASPPTATASKAAPSPTQVPAATSAASATPVASATPAPAQRVVSGQISAVDRRQRLFSVFSADGARTWQVRLVDSSAVVQRDGRAISFEDVGLADQVEVSGTEPAQSPGTLTATAVKVLVSAVAPVPGGNKVHVLFLVDGADSLRPPQYGYTGDWIKRLSDTGYAVTPLEPARISSGRYDLKDFNLIVIGYPATLSPSALQLVTASRKPVLNAEPRLVQPLGLGLNVDPQQPARDLPGRTVEIAGQSSPVTGGLNGETTLAGGRLHRMPIVASGAVLGTLNDGGQRRAVWSVTGTSMYLGFYASDGGQNHNATYWAIFDRSILWLLGRDPATIPLPGA